VIWLDVLDVHLTNHLDAAYRENFSDNLVQNANYFKNASQPIVRPDGYCRERYGTVRARTDAANGGALPFTYKWRDTLRTLKAMAKAGDEDPYDGILLEYTNPLTGGPTMPTIGCRAQWLNPGESTRAHSHSSSTIYHVVQGQGVSTIGAEKNDGKDFVWGTRDCFFVPSKHWHQHRNTSKTEPAILFSVTDRPVLDSLGLYREEQG
jgi:gentisate 1,2-dioxygenase